MPYPGMYPSIDKIIPYSKNKRFGFMEKNLDLESMKTMTIDQIVDLYREGYTVAQTTMEESPSIKTAQPGITISTGTILLIGLGIVGYMWYKHRL